MSPFMCDSGESTRSSASATSSIPLLDFAAWTRDSTLEARRALGKRLVEACRHGGFVYIVNHGVESELLAEAFQWTKKLFNLTMEDKLLAPHPEGYAVHRGYSWPGLEKVSQQGKGAEKKEATELRKVADCKESYEIGSEFDTRQPNIWLPDPTLPGFRPFMSSFYEYLTSISRTILRAIALGLDLPSEDHFLPSHSGLNNQLRLLHYPPVPAAPLEQHAVARMPAHTDWGTFTLLFQDDCGGLEVEHPKRPGEFVLAKPIDGALIMNVGDLLERWTNDKLKSTLHRVAAPPLSSRYSGTGSARMTRARYSIPFFVSPDADAVISCLPTCANEDDPPRYPPVRQGEYCSMRAQAQYPEKQEGHGMK